MTEYDPDSWVILRIETPKQTGYKVLGGWGGGYLYGSSWRLNSGIAKIDQTEDHYMIHGHSGSVYKCKKTGQELRTSMMSPYTHLRKSKKATVALVDVEDCIAELGERL